jgi:hypothetical protein
MLSNAKLSQCLLLAGSKLSTSTLLSELHFINDFGRATANRLFSNTVGLPYPTSLGRPAHSAVQVLCCACTVQYKCEETGVLQYLREGIK